MKISTVTAFLVLWFFAVIANALPKADPLELSGTRIGTCFIMMRSSLHRIICRTKIR
jgi:hypothetical protein